MVLSHKTNILTAVKTVLPATLSFYNVKWSHFIDAFNYYFWLPYIL